MRFEITVGSVLFCIVLLASAATAESIDQTFAGTWSPGGPCAGSDPKHRKIITPMTFGDCAVVAANTYGYNKYSKQKEQFVAVRCSYKDDKMKEARTYSRFDRFTVQSSADHIFVGPIGHSGGDNFYRCRK